MSPLPPVVIDAIEGCEKPCRQDPRGKRTTTTRSMMCAAGRAALAMGRQRARDVILMRQPRVGATMHRPWRSERACSRYLSGTGQYLVSPRQRQGAEVRSRRRTCVPVSRTYRRLPTCSLQYSSTACSRNKDTRQQAGKTRNDSYRSR